MTRLTIILGALAIPAMLAAQEPTRPDTTVRRSSEPVFLSADSVAKLRAAADSTARARAATQPETPAVRRVDSSLVRTNMPVAPATPLAPAAQPAAVAAQPDTAPIRGSETTELSYAPPAAQAGNVWLVSTTTRRGTLSRGMTRGPDGRIFMRPAPDGAVWMVAMNDSMAPDRVQAAPVSGVVREESAGEVAPALSTSVRTGWADMSRADIRELQGAMADAGCAVGATDGIVGARTRHALECVKRKYEITNAELTPVLEALNLRLTSDMQ